MNAVSHEIQWRDRPPPSPLADHNDAPMDGRTGSDMCWRPYKRPSHTHVNQPGRRQWARRSCPSTRTQAADVLPATLFDAALRPIESMTVGTPSVRAPPRPPRNSQRGAKRAAGAKGRQGVAKRRAYDRVLNLLTARQTMPRGERGGGKGGGGGLEGQGENTLSGAQAAQQQTSVEEGGN